MESPTKEGVGTALVGLEGMKGKNRKGFTLVEIMIVVLIIGILMAIAVPNFIKARSNSQTSTCLANLRQIEGAKELWAMENKKSSTDTPTSANLSGAAGYIKTYPTCPVAGTYTIGNIGTRPVCSISGHVLS